MSETILISQKGKLIQVPRQVWEQHLRRVPEHGRHRLNFMTKEHHLIRYFVVKEMPRLGRAVEPKLISETLSLPLVQVETILNELERNLFFLVRDEQGAVSWAYPITIDKTPHHLRFSTGEQIYAA